MKINLFKNFPFKILSFLLAVSFWFFLVIFQNVIYDIKEPLKVDVLNSPTGLEIANVLPEVMIKVAAPKEETAFLQSGDFKAEIDLNGLKEGEYTLPVKVETGRKNINIVSYIPREVTVVLEEMETRTFAVRAEVTGAPSTDFTVGEASSVPRKVTVKGPLSIMESIDYVGHKIELTDSETMDIKGTYTLIAYDKDGLSIEHGLKITPDTVVTELQILREIFEKSVPISVKFASDVDMTRINEVVVKPSAVTVRGGSENLETLSSIKTEPVTADNIEAILTGGEFSIKLIVPENVTLVDEPKITVEIK